MKALWYTAPGVAELRETALPQPGPDDCLVRTLASGVSRGTERLVLHGRVPESQWPVMRAPFQQGDFPFPVLYGYAAVGLVERGPMLGQRVFCLAPHAEAFVAPASMCVPVPDAVPSERAVLAANMETALNICWDAAVLPGERAQVVGAGVVGLLVAALLAPIPGVDLHVQDVDPGRAGLVQALGARFGLAGERDVVVHASASEAGLRAALAACGFEGRVVEASWFGDRAVALPLGEAFHAKRLKLVSSQVGAVAAVMRGRRTHRERLSLALSLLDDARLDALLGPMLRFCELPVSLPAALAPGAAGLCPVVTYS